MTTNSNIKLSGNKKNMYYWFLLLIYCLLIFIQSSYPSPENIQSLRLPYIDKFIHFAVYAILGMLFFMAFRTQLFKKNINMVMALSILSSSFYGMSDEIHQHFVPYRNADIMDFFADVMGSICGVYLFKFIKK